MAISSGAAGILGASAGINAMLRGQIRGEMLRQQKEVQIAEFGQREQQLEIQRQSIEQRAQETEQTPEELMRQEIILRWKTEGIEKLTDEDKIFIGLARPPGQGPATHTSLLGLAERAAKGEITEEEWNSTLDNYLALTGQNPSVGDQLLGLAWARTPKTKERVDRSKRVGGLEQPVVVNEPVPFTEQIATTLDAYRVLDSAYRATGILPPADTIDEIIKDIGKAQPQTQGAYWQGPLTIEQEIQMLEGQEAVYRQQQGADSAGTQ